jgi:hypothetical protein
MLHKSRKIITDDKKKRSLKMCTVSLYLATFSC